MTDAVASTGPRRRPFWPNLLLSLVAFAATLPLLEATVRWLAPQKPSWLAIYRHHPALPTYTYQANANATVDTGESRWTVRTDADGFRVPDPPQAADGRPVILWLGDSFTFGYGVEYQDSFVGRLALDPRGRFQHLNAAVGGHGPTQYRQLLEYLLEGGLRPHAVLVGTFLGNDFLDCVDTKDLPVRDGILGDEGGLKSFLKRNFHLYRLASNALHRLSSPSLGPGRGEDPQVVARRWADGGMAQAELVYQREFARMAELCRAHGVEMAVLVIPWRPMVDVIAKGADSGRSDGLEPRAPLSHAVAALQASHIRYLDLTPFLTPYPVDEVYFVYDGHFTQRGHAIVAEAVRRAWRDLLTQPGGSA